MTRTAPLVHPGRILKMHLEAKDMSGSALARALRVSPNRITKILNGERAITAETAMRLGRYFDNAPRYWMNLQAAFDLEATTREKGDLIEREVLPAA